MFLETFFSSIVTLLPKKKNQIYLLDFFFPEMISSKTFQMKRGSEFVGREAHGTPKHGHVLRAQGPPRVCGWDLEGPRGREGEARV